MMFVVESVTMALWKKGKKMRLTDRSLTMITGVCLAVGVGAAGLFLRDNATINGFAQANAAPSPVLTLATSSDPSSLIQIPAPEDKVVLAVMPRLVEIAPPNNLNSMAPSTAVALCHVDVTATPKIAAQVLLVINAPCLPSTVVTIHHAGLSFREKLSSQGSFSLIIPAFEEFSRFEVDLNDGQRVVATAAVHDLARVNRTAISWQGHRDVDLLASDSLHREISPQNPRSLYQALMDSGGYLTVLGNPDVVDPILAQVVTFFQSGTQAKTVSMSLVMTSCTGILNLRTAQVQPKIGQTGRQLRLRLPRCVKGADKVVLNKVLESMTMAQR